MEASGGYSVETSDLVKRFGSLVAVDGVTLRVRPGEILGLLGPNGAGKTTTVSMCVGLLRPTSGSIRIGGADVQRDPESAKRLIGYLPDTPYLYDKLTGREFVNFMAEIYGTTDRLSERREQLLSFFGLQEAAEDMTAGYSHGMRQKTALCGVLIHEPRILFLDEPTVGLDPRSARQLKDTLQSLARAGRTIVLSTHILKIAQAICTRIAILNRGKIIAEGTMEELRARVNGVPGESLEDVFLELTGDAPADDRAVARALMES